MTKKSFLVKTVLMSMLTAVTFSFASCSDDDYIDGTPKAPSAEMQDSTEVGDYSKFEPYGLTYHNFDGDDNAVQILNADTTEIAVSKKLADKLGIKTFVNHPLGIWRSKGTCAFARKAYEEKLLGDHYILKVKAATVGELIGKKEAMLSTEVIVNENAESVKTRAASSNIPEYAAKYVDENNVIHPSIILLTDPYGYDEQGHYPDEQPTARMTRGADGEYQYLTPEEIVGSKTRFGATGRILKANHTIAFNHKLECGSGSGDTITVKGKVPVDFELNYFLQLDGGIDWKVFIPVPYVKKFEAGLDGQFGFSPEVTVGFSKKLELPEKKQKLELYKFSSYSFTFMVGPIPVSIFCKPSLYMKFDASVEGNAQFGIKYEYANTFRAGVGYYKDGGWKSLNNFEEERNEISLIKPEVNFKAEAGVGLMLGAEVKIYDVAGPEAAVGPRLGAEAEVTANADGIDWHAQIDLSVQAEVGAKLEILGYKLAEYKTCFDLAGPWTLLKYPQQPGDNIHKSKFQQTRENADRAVKNMLNLLDEKKPGGDYRNRYDEMISMYMELGKSKEDATDKVNNELISAFGIKTVESILKSIVTLKSAPSEADKTAAAFNQAYSTLKSYYTTKINDFNWLNTFKFLNENALVREYQTKLGIDANLLRNDFTSAMKREPTPTEGDLKWLVEDFLKLAKPVAENEVKSQYRFRNLKKIAVEKDLTLRNLKPVNQTYKNDFVLNLAVITVGRSDAAMFCHTDADIANKLVPAVKAKYNDLISKWGNL